MAAAAVVAHLTAAGFGIRWAGGRLLVSPADQLTDELRTLIREHLDELRDHVKNRKRPPAPSVKSIKTPKKGTFDTFDTPSLGPFSIFAGFADPLDRPRRLWLIHHPDGRWVSHSFTPGATEQEVRSWYPEALSIEPEESAT